jgi:antitoxin HicB
MNNFTRDDLYGYKVNLYKLSEEQGDGWGAEVEELKGCFADGETPDEAVTNLKEVVEEWVGILKIDGTPLPQPVLLRENDAYSGKFTVRVPKSLHRLISERAEQEEVSLNQLINSILAYNLGMFDRSTSAKDEQAVTRCAIGA